MATVATTSSTGTSNLAISGLASGFDWQSLVSQLADVERSPETQLQRQQRTLQQKNNALGSVKTELSVLQNAVSTVTADGFFDSRTASSSDSTLATASAASGTTLGTYAFEVTQLAAAAVLQGHAGAGAALSTSSDVSGVQLATAGFGNPVTAGTFTVNGKAITVATSDSLKDVFDKISAATGGAVTASYSATGTDADKITLTSSSEIVLGSATDTSNFLQAAKLSNNGTGAITSAATLGAVKTTGALNQANFATPLTTDASGAGSFTINGVTISFNATNDSLSDVIGRINDSGAGVTATYDSTNNRFNLTNKDTGDVGIFVQDVTGNFLAAAGLTTATLAHGKNLLYTVNNGPQLSSQSNTISSQSSGISGLSVTALAEDSFKITVASDTATIKSAITHLVDAYNQVESLIGTQTASTTDSTGKVTAGLLAGDQDIESLSANLRNLMTSATSGTDNSLLRLDSLGFSSNGTSDTLSTTDVSGLNSALASNLSGLKSLFTDSSSGLATQLSKFLKGVIGDNGSLVTEQSNLTKQSTDIDDQISRIEKQVQNYQTQLTNEFVAMETAQAKINQQLQYLQKYFSSNSSSS
jgi:flagellar hook-associated protein 2